MGEYLDSFEEFNEIRNASCRLVEIDRTVPAMVFKINFESYYFADFDILFNSKEQHWDQVLTLTRETETGRLFLMVLDPDPESYHPWCNKYGIVAMDQGTSKEDIFDMLYESPKKGTADAIYVIADRFVAFSEHSPNWCLWADRHYGIAILGVNDCTTRQVIAETLGEEWFNAEQAVYELLPISCWPQPVPEDFPSEFLANYRSRER